VRKFLKNPVVEQFTAIHERYNQQHGPQHAASITYFSVLTLVPVLMLAGAATGFTLAVLRPDWFHLLSDGIVNILGSTDLAKKTVDVLQNAIENWYGLAGTALVAAAYSGSNWVGNLRIGFCRMLQTDEQKIEKENLMVGKLRTSATHCPSRGSSNRGCTGSISSLAVISLTNTAAGRCCRARPMGGGTHAARGGEMEGHQPNRARSQRRCQSRVGKRRKRVVQKKIRHQRRYCEQH